MDQNLDFKERGTLQKMITVKQYSSINTQFIFTTEYEYQNSLKQILKYKLWECCNNLQILVYILRGIFGTVVNIRGFWVRKSCCIYLLFIFVLLKCSWHAVLCCMYKIYTIVIRHLYTLWSNLTFIYDSTFIYIFLWNREKIWFLMTRLYYRPGLLI